ncbi:flagellar assembly protein FliH [Geomonas sp. Red69]|uniref:FliH/SctL family protein n=1 Tax=Geomonas diazotrophica TaxID=2843197 RepID=UPI001C11E1F0|nr:FliH/SctL family protein [Geomonas diazotrophica]MBU5638603.1 flagellar assembly protein FliH [Geomonas diazotrophica]
MFSSKIIRKGVDSEAYTLEPLGGELAPTAGQEVFRPIQLGEEEPALVEEEREPEIPPSVIAEEEALRRIQQAHAEGVKKGRQQAEEDLAKVSEALAQALLSTGALRSQLMHDAEEDLLKLSVLIARKVMMRELSLDPGLIAGLVHGAVELAADEGEIVVRLNPEEYQVVAYSPQFQALSRDRKKITLREDPALGPASCLVETVRGNIDAGLDAQLEEIMRRLSEERNARREEEQSGD